MLRPLIPAMLILAFGPLDWKFPWWMWVLFWMAAAGSVLLRLQERSEA